MSDLHELKQTIDKYDLRPAKSLGQNFLTDETTLGRIAGSLDAGENDLVIEIGPGTGALTSFFAGKVRKTVLIEIDRHLIPVLEDRYSRSPGTEIIHADATRTDLSAICLNFIESGPANGKLKLISNVPYYITTQLIQQFV